MESTRRRQSQPSAVRAIVPPARLTTATSPARTSATYRP